MKKLIMSLAILLNSTGALASSVAPAKKMSVKKLTVSAIDEDSIYVRMVSKQTVGFVTSVDFKNVRADMIIAQDFSGLLGYVLKGNVEVTGMGCIMLPPLTGGYDLPKPPKRTVMVKSKFMKLDVEPGKDFSLEIPADVDYVDFTYDPKAYEKSKRVCAQFVRAEDMLNKATGECTMAGSSCEVEDLVEQGYEIAPAGTCNNN